MKTSLLVLLFLVFVSIGFSQSNFTEIIGPNRHLQLKQPTIHPDKTTPLPGNVIGQKVYDYSIIGTTWNDLQTLNYGNVMQRMWAYPDGTVGSSWLCAGEGDIPERGAGYNYFDGSSWGTPNLHVGPEDRMGSPSYAPWGPDGEIIALYRYAVGEGSIFFYKREVKGVGDWQEVELAPPSGAGVSLVWQSMITSGENHEYIHLLAETYDAVYMGQDNALLYYRSSDGCETWDISEEIIDGLGIDDFATINHLSYAWANPVGNTIAFTYGFDEFGGRVFKSENNGDDWDIIPVFNSPFSSLEIPESSDRFGCGIGTSACALDSEGNVHVAFSRMVKIFDPTGTLYEPYTDGMIYWNESMDPLDTTIISANTMEYLDEAGNLIGWIMGDENYVIPEAQPNYANALCAFPQFAIDANNNLFVAYCSVAPGYSTGTADFRHVIINSSFDGGLSWEGQKDLNTDLIFIFSECVFPMMAPVIDEDVHLTFQEDNQPGINQWLNNHPPDENKIDYMQIPKNTLVGTPDNHVQPTFELSAFYPNPTSNTLSFNIILEKPSTLSFSIMNVMGQSVKEYSSKKMRSGNNSTTIDVSNLSEGIYYCSVNDGYFQITRKFVVQ